MENLNSLPRYYGRFLRRLLRDSYEWPRDNVLIACAMAVLPPLVAFVKNRAFVFDWTLFWTTIALYGILIEAYLVIQIIRTPWKLDSERVKHLQEAHGAEAATRLEIAELKDKYHNERPRLGMRVVNLSERPHRGAIGPTPLNVEFRLCHLSGRPATSVSVDPIYSLGGASSLRLGSLSYLAKDADCAVAFEVWRNDRRPFGRALEALGWGEMLKNFVWDSRASEDEVSFPVVVRFRDADNYESQSFRLIFNHQTYRFHVIDEYPGGWPIL
jgi:hypothetical protein